MGQKDIDDMKSLSIKFFVFAAGVLLVFSSYVSMIVLESSINIKHGLGILSLGLAYGSCVIFSVLFTPFLIRRFGCKYVLLAGETTYIMYIAANFYPVPYTMLPAGVIVGIGEAMIWTVFPMYYVYFGRLHAKTLSKRTEQYVQKYTGRFVATFQLSQVTGNLVSYAILYGRKKSSESRNYANYTNHILLNASKHAMNRSVLNLPFAADFQHCGSKDCQNPNVTGKSLKQYSPQDEFSLYILVGVMTAICVTGVILHAVFLPNYESKSESGNDEMAGLKNLERCENHTTDAEVSCMVFVFMYIFTLCNVQARRSNENLLQLVCNTYKSTFRHLRQKLQFLMTPLTIYYGFHVSFLMGELTRAYSSCILGVEQVGITVVTFATVDGIMALFTSKLVKIKGRNPLIAIAFVLDFLIYIFCLLWIPQNQTTWVVYVIFFLFGVTDGIWKTMLIVIYEAYFPKNQEIAFTAWNMYITIGITLQFMFSTMICISTKIYIKMTCFVLGVVCYGFAERHRIKTSRKTEQTQSG